VVIALDVNAAEPGESDGVASGRCEQAEHSEDEAAVPWPENKHAPERKESGDENLRGLEERDTSAQQDGLEGGAGRINEK
jgi:hypothetical protein